MTLRWSVVLSVVALVAAGAGAPSPALADQSCTYNALCPYQQMSEIGVSDPNTLVGSLAVALTPDGDVAVADDGTDALDLYSRSGELMTSTAVPYPPAGIWDDASTGEIYLDTGCVRMYSSQLAADGTSLCAGRGAVVNGVTVKVDDMAEGDGYVYVLISQGASFEYVELSGAGALLRTWTPTAAGFGAMAVDSSGDLWVSGGEGGTIEFSPAGEIVRSLVTPAAESNDVYGSTLYVESPSAGGSSITAYSLGDGKSTSFDVSVPGVGANASVLSTLPVPGGPTFAVDAEGIVAVGAHDELYEFSLDGTAGASFGGTATTFFDPALAMQDAAGNVDVVDVNDPGYDRRILQYPASGGAPTVLADLSSVFPSSVDYYWATETPTRDIAVEGWAAAVTSDGSEDEIATFDQSGHLVGTTDLDCTCFGPIAIAPDGDIYTVEIANFGDPGPIEQFDASGNLIRQWPVEAESIAVDQSGDVYFGTSNENTEEFGPITTNEQVLIEKYTGDGQPLQSWDASGGFEPFTSFWGLAVAPDGNVWAAASDGIHEYSPSGQMLAVWEGDRPEPADYSLWLGSAITVAPDGDPVVIETQWGGGNARIVDYSDLRDPLPPVPPSSDSPWALEVDNYSLTVGQATQPSADTVAVPVHCAKRSGRVTKATGCDGTITLSALAGRAPRFGRHRSVSLGLASFSVRIGRREVVRLKLNRLARRLLADRSRIGVVVTVRYADISNSQAGTTRQSSRRLTLRAGTRRPR